MKFWLVSVSPSDAPNDRKAKIRFVCAVLLLTFAFGVGAQDVFAQSVTVVQTNPDQSALLTPETPLTFAGGTATGTAINVNDAIHYQQLEGRGCELQRL